MMNKNEQRDFALEQQIDAVIYRLEQIPERGEEYKKLEQECKNWKTELQVAKQDWAEMEAYAREKNHEITQLTAELNFFRSYFNERTKKILRPFFSIYKLMRCIKRKLCEGNRDDATNQGSIITETEVKKIESVDENIYASFTKHIDPRAIIQEYEDVISVIIPTYNGGEMLLALVGMLYRQVGCKKIEVIVVDSGSTDGTLQSMKWIGTKVIEIPKEDFAHSYARNLGAEKASGDYLLFMTQDAMPEDEYWIYKMLQVMHEYDVVAITPMERENKTGDLKYKVDSWCHARYLEVFNEDKIGTMPQNCDFYSIRKNAQLSDTACLVKKEVFDSYLYRGDYAEDLDLGMRLIQDGYQIALLSSVRVIHSHNRPCGYYLRRSLVDNRVLHKIFADFPSENKTEKALGKEIQNSYLATMALIGTIQDLQDQSIDMKMFCQRLTAMVDGDLTMLLKEDVYRDEIVQRCLQECGVLQDVTRFIGNKVSLPDHIRYYVENCLIPYLITKQKPYSSELKEEVCQTLYKTLLVQVGAWLAEYDITHPQEDEIKRMIKDFTVGI